MSDSAVLGDRDLAEVAVHIERGEGILVSFLSMNAEARRAESARMHEQPLLESLLFAS